MNALFTDTARAEIENILTFVAADNNAAAAEIAAVIEATIRRLCSFPRLGAETDVSGVHTIVMTPIPYVIFYSIDGEALVIRNVRHSSQRRPMKS